MKRISRRNFLKVAGVGAAALGLAACGGSSSSTASSTASSAAASAAPAEDVTIKVAAIETGYGADMWKKVTEAFTAQTGIKVELTTDKKLEDVIGPSMQGGDYPDVVHLATGREAALTEQFIKGNLIADITDVLSMTVPGESKKVSEKIAGGFTDTSLTNPYGDGKTYLAPMFYSPCGLFYNAGFLKEKGWEVPTTWDEMWELGDKAAAEGTYLFTYPTTGYFDAFFYALKYAAGGRAGGAARRKGDKWYVGGITNDRPYTTEIALDFLPAGRTFTMTSFEDGVNADLQATDYRKRVREVDASTVVKVEMVRNGGWAAVIE